MRRFAFAAAALAAALSCFACTASPRKTEGSWAGGWTRGDDFHLVMLTIATMDGVRVGEVRMPKEDPAPILQKLSWDDEQVRIELLRGGERHLFAGRVDGATLHGEVTIVDWTGAFDLVRVATIGQGTLAELAGSYRFEDGTELQLSLDRPCLVASTGGSAPRALFPRDAAEWFTGPAGHAPVPETAVVRVERDAADRVTGLVWTEGGSSRRAARQ